jgi:FKBP12-rapamycin complex-associated protein
MMASQAVFKRSETNELFSFTTVSKTRSQVGSFLSPSPRYSLSCAGRDFDPEVVLNIEAQVEQLIEQATALENLCQCYFGWGAFW